ncbi:hypothetical protein ACI797_18720 [Geodermatophilus sp. SYSU D00691]
MGAATAERAEVTYLATVVLPYHDVRSAARGLRSELRHRVAAVGGGDADWDSLVLTGPVAVTDRLGRDWFEYTAAVRGPAGAEAAVRQT